MLPPPAEGGCAQLRPIRRSALLVPLASLDLPNQGRRVAFGSEGQSTLPCWLQAVAIALYFDVLIVTYARDGRYVTGALEGQVNDGPWTDIDEDVQKIYALSEVSDLYISGGTDFHSNDARGTTISVDPGSVDPVDPLVRSRGGEMGFKTVRQENWIASLAVWALELDSALPFVGDAGTTEASRPSRHWGIEFNHYHVFEPRQVRAYVTYRF